MSMNLSVNNREVTNMTFDFPDCGGCKTCELACSFHLIGEFNYKNSAIKIIENKDKSGFSVDFLDKCDFCLNEDEPFCVQYCRESEKLTEFLNKFTRCTKKKEDKLKGGLGDE